MKRKRRRTVSIPPKNEIKALFDDPLVTTYDIKKRYGISLQDHSFFDTIRKEYGLKMDMSIVITCPKCYFGVTRPFWRRHRDTGTCSKLPDDWMDKINDQNTTTGLARIWGLDPDTLNGFFTKVGVKKFLANVRTKQAKGKRVANKATRLATSLGECDVCEIRVHDTSDKPHVKAHVTKNGNYLCAVCAGKHPMYTVESYY